jgi:hypothetical protein
MRACYINHSPYSPGQGSKITIKYGKKVRCSSSMGFVGSLSGSKRTSVIQASAGLYRSLAGSRTGDLFQSRILVRWPWNRGAFRSESRSLSRANYHLDDLDYADETELINSTPRSQLPLLLGLVPNAENYLAQVIKKETSICPSSA